MTNQYVRERLHQLRHTNPTVRAALYGQAHDARDEVETLRIVVVALADQNEALQRQLVDAIEWSCKPVAVANYQPVKED